MKDLLKKPVTFEKVEFWAATAVYVFAVFILLGTFVNLDGSKVYTIYTRMFEYNGMPYSYTKYWFLPQLCRYTIFYGCYLLLTFYIIKPMIAGEKIFFNIMLLICLYVTAVILLGSTQTWIKAYLLQLHSERYVYRLLFKTEFVHTLYLLVIFGFYIIAKNTLSVALVNFEDVFKTQTQVAKECFVVLGIWITGVFFCLMTRTEWTIAVIWSEVLLFCLLVYWYASTMLIPKVIAEGGELNQFLQRIGVIIFFSVFPVGFVIYVIFFHRIEAPIIINLTNIGIGLFIVSPVSWFVYQRRLSNTEVLQGLKTALGSSSANLDFLRSQINPHFLFNALNTLYGTSLQENAERTGEGIQKLGDMMRFMLQENLQEKIALSREVDYLNNYIDLQKLRTQLSPDILIIVEIDEQPNMLQIAPMLLIPFVENAFKHGISLREPSHIKISLQTKGSELLFDVYNSIHNKTGTDPEQDKNGIGLENVKQRLELLYPKRHELVIRESAKEFFIHLTIQLS